MLERWYPYGKPGEATRPVRQIGNKQRCSKCSNQTLNYLGSPKSIRKAYTALFFPVHFKSGTCINHCARMFVYLYMFVAPNQVLGHTISGQISSRPHTTDFPPKRWWFSTGNGTPYFRVPIQVSEILFHLASNTMDIKVGPKKTTLSLSWPTWRDRYQMKGLIFFDPTIAVFPF